MMFRSSVLAAAVLWSAVTAQNESSVESTIDDIILANADGDLTALGLAFQTSGLVGVLCTNCNYTVFAPIDSAFEAMDQDRLNDLLEVPNYIAHLQQFLGLHATYPTADRVYSADFVNGMTFQTQTSNMENLTVRVNNSEIVISSSNTEASKVIDADNIAMNGNIHKVDQVLLPEWWNVVDLKDLPGSSDFDLIFELFGVAEIELGMEDATILAPSNNAFLALGNEKLDEWKNGTNLEELQSVLTQHIIDQLYPSILIKDGAVASTGSSSVTFTKSSDGKISVNGANVVKADVLAAHTIVHVIDQLLVSENVTTPPTSSIPSASPPSSSPGDEKNVTVIPTSVPSASPPSSSPGDGNSVAYKTTQMVVLILTLFSGIATIVFEG